MKYAFFCVILAVLVLPVETLQGPSDPAAGPCNPTVERCP